MKKILLFIVLIIPLMGISQNRFDQAIKEAADSADAKLNVKAYIHSTDSLTKVIHNYNMKETDKVLVTMQKKGVIVRILPNPYLPDWLSKPNYLVLLEGEKEPIVCRKKDLKFIKATVNEGDMTDNQSL